MEHTEGTLLPTTNDDEGKDNNALDLALLV